MTMARRGSGLLTTGDVARLAGCAPRTVQKWHDQGKLPGYKLPGSLTRRFRRGDVVAFFKAHGVPCAGLGDELFRVLVLGDAGPGAELDGREGLDVRRAGTLFAAGVLAADWPADAAVIDLGIGRPEAVQAARSLRAASAPYVVGLVYPDETGHRELLTSGFDQLFDLPLRPGQLAACLYERAEVKRRGR